MWRWFSATDPLRLPSLVFSIFCIHQLGILSGQENERVALWTGSVTDTRRTIRESREICYNNVKVRKCEKGDKGNKIADIKKTNSCIKSDNHTIH